MSVRITFTTASGIVLGSTTTPLATWPAHAQPWLTAHYGWELTTFADVHPSELAATVLGQPKPAGWSLSIAVEVLTDEPPLADPAPLSPTDAAVAALPVWTRLQETTTRVLDLGAADLHAFDTGGVERAVEPVLAADDLPSTFSDLVSKDAMDQNATTGTASRAPHPMIIENEADLLRRAATRLEAPTTVRPGVTVIAPDRDRVLAAWLRAQASWAWEDGRLFTGHGACAREALAVARDVLGEQDTVAQDAPAELAVLAGGGVAVGLVAGIGGVR